MSGSAFTSVPLVELKTISVLLTLYMLQEGVITFGTGCTFGSPNFANPVKIAANEVSNCVFA